MAEQTLDKIIPWLRASNGGERQTTQCRTAIEPLLPESETAGVSGILPPEYSRRLIELFARTNGSFISMM